MSRIWSFHGGIHPQENKEQSSRAALRQPPLPERLVLPLQQHIGAPAVAVVEAGEQVLKGQIIAEPNGPVSIYMHAPTSGIVISVTDQPIPHPSGMSGPCVVIEPDGEDRWIEHQGVEDYTQLSKDQLTELIRQAGISGLGGAGFPTSVKLNLRDDHIINTLIINGVECEPYITADDLLMRERADAIMGGIEIANQLINPTHILVGIEDNKPEAAMAMTEAARRSRLNIEVVVIPTKYPSGGERQLIQVLTGVEVPHGKLPADIGIVVQNVGTMAAVYDAIHEGKPLISRFTTLTGEALSQPGNLEVLMGTPIEHLLQFTGCDNQILSRLIMGGPMMGFTLDNDQIPVIKTTNCIIAGTLEEFPPAPIANPCIRCGACEQACPAELLPQQLYWFSKGRELDKAINHNIMDCIECGACSYVCPSHIPLVQYYRHTKAEIRTEQQEQEKSERARLRFEARQARMEAAEREKEERRKARAEAAAKTQAKKRDAAFQRGETDATQASPEADLKQLKTDAAVARTKLKKLEKALAQAEAEGSESLSDLRQEHSTAQQRCNEAQQKLEQAEANNPAPAVDINELKIAAASAKTKVSKTEKAIADAEAKGSPSAEKLQASLAMLQEKAAAAQQALDAAQQASPAKSIAATPVAPESAAPADAKALKSAAAIARTKLKKAQKALAQAEEEGIADTALLESDINTLALKLKDAEAALTQQQAAEPADQGADLKALKTAAAVARTKLKKTEKALAEAQEKGSAAAEQLQKAIPGLQQKVTDAEQALAAAETETADEGVQS